MPFELADWDPRTVYLVDLVAHAFADPRLFVQNITAVHVGPTKRRIGDEISPG